MIQFIWWFFGFKRFFYRKEAQSHLQRFVMDFIWWFFGFKRFFTAKMRKELRKGFLWNGNLVHLVVSLALRGEVLGSFFTAASAELFATCRKECFASLAL